MYDRILYPTDGSDGAEAALDHVQTLASAFDATVHVLYAAEDQGREFGLGSTGVASADGNESSPGLSGDHHETDPEGVAGGSSPDSDESNREVVAEAEAAVEAVAERFDGVATEPVVRSGTPYEVIREYADDIDADLIVMGTHGRTGIDRMLIGSVTEKVIRTADVPVVTVSRTDEDSSS